MNFFKKFKFGYTRGTRAKQHVRIPRKKNALNARVLLILLVIVVVVVVVEVEVEVEVVVLVVALAVAVAVVGVVILSQM